MFNFLLKILPTEFVYAHCDIPCGIYDPSAAQIAAKTALRMTKGILELPTDGAPADLLQARNTFVRMVRVKEDHAQRCEHEVLILWTDYFKPEHFERWPDLSDKVLNISKLTSAVKQKVDLDSAQKLVEAVNELADIFNQTKST